MLEHFSNANSQNTEINDLLSSSSVLEMLMMSSGDVKPEPDDHIIITDSSSLWPSDDFARILNYGNVSEFHHPHLPRTISCPPNMVLIENNKGRESFKKRKADERPPSYSKVAAEEKSQEKKLKGGCVEGDQSKITKQYNNNCKSTNTATCSTNSNTNKNNNKQSADNNNKSKENSKASDAPKPDYIHVRARRGQATDSHSLAERVRREKISERMRYLQDLVPGCNKVTGKAGMLDEIINYVQSLQKQVEFLSMKLAAMNPSPIDFDVDSYLGKEVYTSNIPTVGASSSSANSHHQLQFNELMSSQGISCSNVGTGISNIHHQDLTTLRRTTSAPVSLIPDAFLDSPCLNQLPWDDDLQNLYTMELQQAGRSTAFMSQQFTGFFDAGHVKQEM